MRWPGGSGRLPGIGIALLIAAAALLLLRGSGGSGGSAESSGPDRGERVTASVVRVVDGDTIVVTLDGVEESVRYIGIDTPETSKPGQALECFANEATELNRRLVTEGRVVLGFDRELRDAYDRLLAYVWARGGLLNAELVRLGAARTLTIEPNTARAGTLARLEAQAGRAGRGLWGDCPS
jgi:micrococcal nuclease